MTAARYQAVDPDGRARILGQQWTTRRLLHDVVTELAQGVLEVSG